MIAYVGIGANLGDARANVRDALARLDAYPGCRLRAASGNWRRATKPRPLSASPRA